MPDNAEIAALKYEAALLFIREIADLKKDGEGGEFERENDDTWETLHGLISEARQLLGLPEHNPLEQDVKHEGCDHDSISIGEVCPVCGATVCPDHGMEWLPDGRCPICELPVVQPNGG